MGVFSGSFGTVHRADWHGSVSFSYFFMQLHHDRNGEAMFCTLISSLVSEC
jgi:hypothetical protein